MAQVDGYELFACPECGYMPYDPGSTCSRCQGLGLAEVNNQRPNIRYDFSVDPNGTEVVSPTEWVRIMLQRANGNLEQRENSIYRGLVAELIKEMSDATIPMSARQLLTRLEEIGIFLAAQRQEAARKHQAEMAAQRQEAGRRNAQRFAVGDLIPCPHCKARVRKKNLERHLRKVHGQ